MEKIRSNHGIVHTVCVLIVICIFGTSAMMLCSIGATVYKNIAKRNLESFELRTSLSYVKTKINQYDEEGRIDIREIDGVKTIVLSEEVDGEFFDTMIYFKDGKLFEMTGLRGLKFELENGFTILNVDYFDIEKEDNMIKLVARDSSDNTETLYVKLRTG